jgi:hypothetical protein
MGRRKLVLVAAATILAALGCRQLVGIGDDPPRGAASTDAGADGGFSYGLRAECTTCVATNCAAQATACAGTPSCAALEGCLSACGANPTCRAQCGAEHGLGNDGATPAFEACLAGSCAAACELTCGGLAALFPPATATACESCIAGGGECAPVTACAVDPECQTALRCQFSSHTPDVQQACPLAPDAGLAVGPRTGVIPIATSCSKACSWGADWSCFRKVDWPLPTQGPLALTVGIYDVVTDTPIPGATVKLCESADLPCPTGFATQPTGSGGEVTLNRGPIPYGVLYYLDVSSPAIVPTLVFDIFPISMPRLVTTPGVLTPDELAFAAAELPVTLDPALGTMIVYAFDCRLGLAPNVQVSLDPMGPSTKRFYTDNGFVSTKPTATDRTGEAVFSNTPVTPTVLTLSVTPEVLDGGVSGTMHAFARDGGMSIVYALPTP